MVQGSVRVMPACMVMGEAAGIAAAHATKLPACDVHKVDVLRLRSCLQEEGGCLPEPSQRKSASQTPGDGRVHNA
jgi:hypothetical protein